MNCLSPKIEARKSVLNGYGSFAKENIARGEVILDLGIGEQKLINGAKAGELYKNGFDYMLQVEDDQFAITVKNPEEVNQGYINHSCNPNCSIEGSMRIIAMRDIEPGEEVAFDYAMSESSEYEMECKCGSVNCRKIITGNDWKLPKLQEKYKGFFSGYLMRRME